MIIHPKRKTFELSIAVLENIAAALDGAQEVALSDSVNQDDARAIVQELNFVRESLAMERQAVRHPKWEQ